MEGRDILPELKPLKITCTSTKCEDDLHCFKRSRKQKAENPRDAHRGGSCRSCNAETVDWDRIYKHNIDDVVYTVSRLRKEMIRDKFWNEILSQKAINYAIRKGRLGLRKAVRKRIISSVGKSSDQLYNDGTQTPIKDIVNPIHAAQHATATCCRKCIEYWHNIPTNRDLTHIEIEYLSSLIDYYTDQRLPDLEEQGKKVPAMRRWSIDEGN